jgi:hypothetical protein
MVNSLRSSVFLKLSIIVCLFFIQRIAFAQCDPPTDIANINVTNVTCPGNGKVSLSGISPAVAAPAKYQFALYTPSGAEVKPWQDDSTFTNIDAGQFVVYTRAVCPSGPSEILQRYVNLSDQSATITYFDAYPSPAVNCCNGTIYAESYTSNWLFLPKFSLVNSLNAVDIPANYVRPKQEDPEFRGLCAGTYYVRVYDDCGNYQTLEKVVGSVTRTIVLNNTSVNRLTCDSLNMYYGFYDTTPVQNANVVEKSWIQWPDGSLDTMSIMTVNSAYPYLRFNTLISKLDAGYDPSQPFPASVQWPAVVKVYYKDMCGTVAEFTHTINSPGNLAMDLSNFNTDGCDSVSYFPTFSYGPRSVLGSMSYMDSKASYSTDDGATWADLAYSYPYFKFTLKRGQTFPTKFAICGDTISVSISVPEPEPIVPVSSLRDATGCVGDLYVAAERRKGIVSAVLTAGPASAYPLPGGVSINGGTGVRFDNLPMGTYTYIMKDSLNENCVRTAEGTATITQRPFEVNTMARNDAYACVGRTSIGFVPGGVNSSYITEGRPVFVEVLNQPAGAGLPASFVIEGWTDNVVYPEILRNVIAGNYDFQFTDSIGTDCPRSTSASISIPQEALLDVDFDYEPACNGIVNFVSKSSVKTIGTNGQLSSSPFYGAWMFRFIDSTNTVHNYTSSTSANLTNMTTTRTVNAIPPGTYTVQAFLWSDSCRTVEKTIYLGFRPITIPSARVLAGCQGSPASATLVAPATQGSGNYTYTLFQGSVTEQNQVAGPQSSPVFANVTPGVQYIVVATDECGSGTQRTASAAEYTYPIGTSAQKYCPGDTMTLSVSSIAGATYQWYKDGNPISGQTGHQLSISNVQFPADNGQYTANIYIQDCILASTQVNVVVDCTPMPVTLVRFAAVGRENHVQLDWETTFESGASGFSIERSTDAKTWQSIGFVGAATNGETAYGSQVYGFQDHELFANTQFYRLKCIDLDGTYTYSSIRNVRLLDENLPVVFPNPASKLLVVRNVSRSAEFKIVDLNGQVLHAVEKGVYENSIWKLDVGQLVPGVYLLRIDDQAGNRQFTRKVVIVR